MRQGGPVGKCIWKRGTVGAWLSRARRAGGGFGRAFHAIAHLTESGGRGSVVSDERPIVPIQGAGVFEAVVVWIIGLRPLLLELVELSIAIRAPVEPPCRRIDLLSCRIAAGPAP